MTEKKMLGWKTEDENGMRKQKMGYRRPSQTSYMRCVEAMGQGMSSMPRAKNFRETREYTEGRGGRYPERVRYQACQASLGRNGGAGKTDNGPRAREREVERLFRG